MSESANLETASLETASLESTSLESTSLIMVQFLTWVADRPRNYAEVMAAWRTTCPRLSVWEDAIIGGLVRIDNDAGRAVNLTPRGHATLANAMLTKPKAPAL